MRRQLQDRAKALGIKANSKTDVLVEELRNAGEQRGVVLDRADAQL